MKKSIIKIVIFAILILIPTIAQAKTFNKVKFDVSPEYEELSVTDNSIVLMSKTNNSGIGVIIVDKEEGLEEAFDMDAEEIARKISSSYDSKYSKIISSAKNTKIGKEDAISFRTVSKTKNKLYTEYSIIKTKDKLVLIYLSSPNQRDLDGEEFQKVRDTFEIRNNISTATIILIIVIALIVIATAIFLIWKKKKIKEQ